MQQSVQRSRRGLSFVAAIFVLTPLLCSLVAVLLVPTMVAVVASTARQWLASDWGNYTVDVGSGENTVTKAAREIGSHLKDCRGMVTSNAIWNGCFGLFPRYAAYDDWLANSAYMRYGEAHCPGCIEWENGSFQCVSFVLAAYSQTGHPLSISGNGNQFDTLYATPQAKALGFTHIPIGGGALPMAPGDIMAWSGGTAGHVSIVLSWQAPVAGHPGKITFIQGNARGPVDSLQLDPKTAQPMTNDGYWNGYQVTAYIHPNWLPLPVKKPTVTGSQPFDINALVPNNPYVPIARDAARQEGIDENIFLRQIYKESGFNAKAQSPKGAEGIAQLMPGTAAQLGVDPWEPTQALYGAARYDAQNLKYYDGDYAKALAAYNSGPGNVNIALQCGVNWRRCLSAETQSYLTAIGV